TESSLIMALSFFIMSVASFHFMGPRIDLAVHAMTIGADLGSGAVLLAGIPLVASAWRSTPCSRILLLVPLLILLTWFLLAILYQFMSSLLPYELRSFLPACLRGKERDFWSDLRSGESIYESRLTNKTEDVSNIMVCFVREKRIEAAIC